MILAELLGRIVKQSVLEGRNVRLEGLGSFCPDSRSGLRFIAESAPRVFIAYVQEDAASAMRLADDLSAAGMLPWIDRRKLVPGQNWRRAIDRAIERADFFIPCFSRAAVVRRGQFPREIRFALRCAEKMPLDDVFLFPVRLDDCQIPQEVSREIEYASLFPDWEAGVAKLAGAVWTTFGARLERL